jgi:hypothetical protein
MTRYFSQVNNHEYIRFARNDLRGIGLLRGLDKISAKTHFCTNSGAVRIYSCGAGALAREGS